MIAALHPTVQSVAGKLAKSSGFGRSNGHLLKEHLLQQSSVSPATALHPWSPGASPPPALLCLPRGQAGSCPSLPAGCVFQSCCLPHPAQPLSSRMRDAWWRDDGHWGCRDPQPQGAGQPVWLRHRGPSPIGHGGQAQRYHLSQRRAWSTQLSFALGRQWCLSSCLGLPPELQSRFSSETLLNPSTSQLCTFCSP